MNNANTFDPHAADPNHELMQRMVDVYNEGIDDVAILGIIKDAVTDLDDDSRTAAALVLAAKAPGIRAFLEVVSDATGCYGVEYLPLPDGTEAPYVNTGDTYAVTVVAHGLNLAVTSWGDFYENAEREYAEETGLDRCFYCGDWGCEDHDEE